MISTSTSTNPDISAAGYRAAECFIRPWPHAVHGDVVDFGFDLDSAIFHLTLNAPSSTAADAPTEVFLPGWHFPSTSTTVEVSVGKWEVITETIGHSETQLLRWWHAEGEQMVTVKGLARKNNGQAPGGTSTEEEAGYFQQVQNFLGLS
jgi:hypothetical protein